MLLLLCFLFFTLCCGHLSNICNLDSIIVIQTIKPPFRQPPAKDRVARATFSQNGANGMHARKDGMRFLTARRASQEMALERLLASAFIPREANRPADALANMDVPAFVRLIRAEHPTAGLCRLAVPAAYADLRSLVDWKGACVA